MCMHAHKHAHALFLNLAFKKITHKRNLWLSSHRKKQWSYSEYETFPHQTYLSQSMADILKQQCRVQQWGKSNVSVQISLHLLKYILLWMNTELKEVENTSIQQNLPFPHASYMSINVTLCFRYLVVIKLRLGHKTFQEQKT